MGKGRLQVTTSFKLQLGESVRGRQAQTFSAQKLHVGADPFADCKFESFIVYILRLLVGLCLNWKALLVQLEYNIN
jgi:hypothetical protein